METGTVIISRDVMFDKRSELDSARLLSSVLDKPEQKLPVLLDLVLDDTVETPDLCKFERISVHNGAKSDAQREDLESSETVKGIESSNTVPELSRSSRVSRKLGSWRRSDLAVAPYNKGRFDIIEPSSYSFAVNCHDVSF